MSMKELDAVVLIRDLPEHQLRAGDIGTVVEAACRDALMVEFVLGSGRTQALVTLSGGDVRPIGPDEMTAVRTVESRPGTVAPTMN